MKFTVAAILALGVAPAYSLSYLNSLGGAAPAVAAAAPAAEAPFFFTNGAQDEPAGASPAFFFTNDSTEQPAEVAGSSTNYLGALGGGAPSPTGPGLASYVDSLPQNPSASGAGLQSYSASLSSGAAPAAPAAPVAEAAPAASFESSSSAPPTTGSYLEGLPSGSSVSGPGMASYFDALPPASVVAGGAGIASYLDALPPSNVVGGPGMASYADALGGGFSASGKFASPFGTTNPAPAFASGVVSGSTGNFKFTVGSELAEQLAAGGDRRVILKGKITSIN